MSRRIRVWRALQAGIPLLVLALAGCEGAATTTSPEAPALVEQQFATANVSRKNVPGGTDPIVIQLLRTVTGLPARSTRLGQCNTRVRVPRTARNSTFWRSRISLSFSPEMLEEAGGATIQYRFWRVLENSDGYTLTRFADCLIPRTQGALDQTWDWFNQGAVPLTQASASEFTGGRFALRTALAAIVTWFGPKPLFAAQDPTCHPEVGCEIDDIVVNPCTSVDPDYNWDTGECDGGGGLPDPLPGDPPPDEEGGTCNDPTFCGEGGSGGAGNDPNALVATLVCSPGIISHGAQVTCNVSDGTEGQATGSISGKSISWTFTSGGVQLAAQSADGLQNWFGPMVTSGTVTVTVEGIPPVTKALTVKRRLGWGWAPRGTVLGHNTWPFGLPPDTLGMTCWTKPSGPCVPAPTLIFQPEPSATPTTCVGTLSSEGWACATVTGAGPNGGLWYVTSASWSLHRRSGINPAFNDRRPFTPLTAQAECSPDPDGQGTWEDYNLKCQGRTTASGCVPGIIAHEMGHVDQGTAAAGTNDAVLRVEHLVRKTQAELAGAVSFELGGVDFSIRSASTVHPTGNFAPGSAPWYFWRGGGYVPLIVPIASF